MRLSSAISLTLCLLLAACLSGCGWFGGPADVASDFVLGDLIEPFTPPPLAELDKTAKWTKRDVLDSLKLYREYWAEQGPPVAPVGEVLALRNDTPEDNTKILNVLGRLAADDSEINWDAEIIRHTSGDLKSTNPVLVSSVAENDVASLTNFGLFSFDWRFKPFAVQDSVVSWDSSEDRLYDKVVLRDDLFWSDGTPITAHDVEFSYRVIMSSKVDVPAQRSGTEKLKFVKAYDDRTLVFFHKESLATNDWNLNFSVIPKHIYEKSIAEDPTLIDSDYHVAQEDNPVVGGAYNLVERVRGQSYTLEARESYYMHNGKKVRDRPYFKRIVLKVVAEPSVSLLMLNAGDLHEKILTPEEWKTKTNDDAFYSRNTKVYGEEWTTFHFCWNIKDPFFSDVKVRRAMSLAFNHDELITTLRFGVDTPCRGIFNPESGFAPTEPPAEDFNHRDLKAAELLLDEAGWKDSDGDGIRDKMIDGVKRDFDFTVLVFNRSDRIAICNLLKSNLGQIGIRCQVTPLDFAVLQEKMLKKEFQAAFAGWGTGTYPDTTENIFSSKGERNYGSYSNPEVDALFEKALKSLDETERQKIFQEIHKILYSDQAYTWLFYQNAYYAFSKKLRGYKFSPRGPYHYAPGFGSLWMPLMAP